MDCQEAIVSLQLQTHCTVRLCTGPEQLAEYILTLTKAVSEKPFRLAVLYNNTLYHKEIKYMYFYIITVTSLMIVLFSLYRKESPFSFHPDAVTGNKKKVYIVSYISMPIPL